MADLMTYPYTTSHISLKSQVFQAFSQHVAIHRGAFRHGAHGDPRLRRQEDRDHAGLAAIDNEAVVTEAALGRRHCVAQHRATACCGGWFVCHVFLHVSTHISRRAMRASRLWVHGCNEERVLAAALINSWISVEPCCTVAGSAAPTPTSFDDVSPSMKQRELCCFSVPLYDLLLALAFFHFPCLDGLKLVHSLSTAAVASTEFCPFPAMCSS